jgi:hypothetical protein
MLTRVLNVKERLNKFVREHKPSNTTLYRPYDDRLTPSEWLFIERLYTSLEAYHAATMLAQGHKAWLSDWFILLYELLNDVDR